MANDSLLPTSGGGGAKFILLGLLLLGGAAAAWYFLIREEPQPTAPPVKVAEMQKPPAYVPEFAEPEIVPDAGKVAVVTKKKAFSRRQCNGTLSTSELQKAMNAGPRKQVRACYERQLKANNNLQGSLNLEVTIGPTGRVAGVRSGGSLRSRAVTSCVRNSAKSWRFPAPSGGCVRTQVPFNLSPKR